MRGTATEITTTRTTPPTTSTDRAPAHVAGGAASRSEAGLAVLLLGIGLVLVCAGLPRFVGAAHAEPARAVLTAVRDGRAVPDADLARAIAALTGSLRAWAPAHAHSDLALLLLLRTGGATGSDGAPEAIDALEAGIAGAPAGASGWGRLAHARYLHSGLTKASRAALEMSLRPAGADVSLAAFQLDLILREWDALGPGLRAAGRDRIRELTRHGDPGYDALVDVYLASPRAWILDEVLAELPPRREHFARRLERRVGRP